MIHLQSIHLYGDFLRLLRNQPEQLAYWLATGERLSYDPQAYFEILHCIVTGLYGCTILPDDTNLMLLLLKQLAYLQLVSCDNPRRLVIYFFVNIVAKSMIMTHLVYLIQRKICRRLYP